MKLKLTKFMQIQVLYLFIQIYRSKKFFLSVMVSDILKSSSQYLEDSIDCLFSKSKLQEENNNFRQKIAAVCFEYRSVINEVRARASKGLGFAKLLCKDLGIAAKYEIISPYEKCFSKLKSSNHIMVSVSICN